MLGVTSKIPLTDPSLIISFGVKLTGYFSYSYKSYLALKKILNTPLMAGLYLENIQGRTRIGSGAMGFRIRILDGKIHEQLKITYTLHIFYTV